MKLSNLLPLSAVKSVGFISLGGILGYTANAWIHAVQDQGQITLYITKEFSAVLNRLNEVDKKVSELAARHEKLSQHTYGNAKALGKLSEQLASGLNDLRINASVQTIRHADLNHETVEQSQSARSQEKTDLPEPEIAVSGQVDADALQTALADMHSPNIETRQQALRALMLVGSPEVKLEIGRIIFNDEEDVNLRRELIQSLNWHGVSEQLINLFQTAKDYNVRAAAILAAETSQLDESERLAFESVLQESFAEEPDNFVKIATLDYFSNNNPSKLQEFFDNSDEAGGEDEDEGETMSSAVRKHLEFLLTPDLNHEL